MGLQQLEAASPFLFSSDNVLIGIGLNVYSTCVIDNGDANSCASQVIDGQYPEDGTGVCTGKGCCEAGSSQFQGHLAHITLRSSDNGQLYPNDTCNFGMLVEKGWYEFTVGDAYGKLRPTWPTSSRGASLWFWTSPSGKEACAHQRKASGHPTTTHASATTASASGQLTAMVITAAAPKGMEATLT
jgi:hypothetical protein